MAEAMKAEISCMLKGIDRYAQSQIENLNFAYLVINKSDSKIFVLFLSFFFRSLEINITFFTCTFKCTSDVIIVDSISL